MQLGWRWTVPRQAITAVPVALALAAAAILWAAVVGKLQTVRPVPVHFRPTAIVWNDRVFESRASLARWLESRGASYASWARIHPAASAVIDPSHRAASGAAAAPARRQNTTSVPRDARGVVGTQSSRHTLHLLFVVLSSAIGALCIALGVLPRLPAAQRIWPAVAPVAGYGSVLVAVAAAIFVGLLIALALG